MTDDDLMTLHHEEQRLYYRYVKAAGEESRYPKKVAAKRSEWIALHDKLKRVLPPDKLRRLLQERAAEEQRKVKR